MSKKRQSDRKTKQEEETVSARWAGVLKRRKQKNGYPYRLSSEEFEALIEAYLAHEIPADMFSVIFLQAFKNRMDGTEYTSQLEDEFLWPIYRIVEHLPSFRVCAADPDMPEETIRKYLSEMLPDFSYAIRSEREHPTI